MAINSVATQRQETAIQRQGTAIQRQGDCYPKTKEGNGHDRDHDLELGQDGNRSQHENGQENRKEKDQDLGFSETLQRLIQDVEAKV